MDFFVLKTDNLIGPVATGAGIFAMSFLILLTLSAITIILIDRILIVKFPAKYMAKATSRRARRAIFVMWVSVLVVTILSTSTRFAQEPMLPEDNPFEYILRWYNQHGKMAIFVPFGFVSVLVVLPSAYLYWLIRKRRNVVLANDARPQMAHAGDRKLTESCQTVLFAMVLYLVCYLPLMTVTILEWYNIELFTEFEKNRGFYFMVFTQLSSLINPYMFIIRSSKIRTTAGKTISALARRINIIPRKNQVQDRSQNNAKSAAAHKGIELQNLDLEHDPSQNSDIIE